MAYFQVGKKGTFSSISAVTVGPLGEIVVADSRVQMFSAKGDFLEVVYDDRKGTFFKTLIDTFISLIIVFKCILFKHTSFNPSSFNKSLGTR